MEKSSLHVVNEIGRCLVSLPVDATYYRDERFIAIVFDSSPSGVTPSLVLGSGQRLKYATAHDLFSRLCDDRAQRAVDQSLLLNGKPVTPERYLATWRKSMARASSIDQLLHDHGLTVRAILQGRIEPMRLRKSGSSSSPFKCFADFESRYAKRIQYDDQGKFEVALDLREPGAARDAWYAAEMSPYNPPDVMTATLAISGQVRCHSDSDLFESPNGLAEA